MTGMTYFADSLISLVDKFYFVKQHCNKMTKSVRDQMRTLDSQIHYSAIFKVPEDTELLIEEYPERKISISVSYFFCNFLQIIRVH